MRKLSLFTVSAFALAGSIGAASAQDNTPATHRGTGTEIADRYRMFHEDRARMQNGAHEKAMQAARESVYSFTNLRAREGRPVTPRR